MRMWFVGRRSCVNSHMRGFISRSLERIKRIASSLRKAPLIAISLLLGVVLYTIFHRTPEEFLVESFPIAAFVTFISYNFFVMRWILFGLPKISVHLFLLPVLYLPVVIVITTLGYYGVWVALRDSYVWIQYQSPPRIFFITLTGILVIVVGYALFLFRLHVRFFFGLGEALIGLLIALRNIPTNADPVMWSSQVFLVILTAGVFLVVRGFDNMHTGFKSESRDSILKTFDESEYGTLAKSLYGKSNEQ